MPTATARRALGKSREGLQQLVRVQNLIDKLILKDILPPTPAVLPYLGRRGKSSAVARLVRDVLSKNFALMSLSLRTEAGAEAK